MNFDEIFSTVVTVIVWLLRSRGAREVNYCVVCLIECLLSEAMNFPGSVAFISVDTSGDMNGGATLMFGSSHVPMKATEMKIVDTDRSDTTVSLRSAPTSNQNEKRRGETDGP